MASDELRSPEAEHNSTEAESSPVSPSPQGGSTPAGQAAVGRSSKRTFATAGLAVVLFGVAGAVIYRYLPEELEQLRRARAQAAVAPAPSGPPKPVVVDDAPDPADVTTRVVVIDAGTDGAAPVVALARPRESQDWGVVGMTSPCLILRELVRQAMLIAARDELGLGTRDEILDDVAPPAAGRDVGELSTNMRIDGARGLFRRGDGRAAEVLWKRALGRDSNNSNFLLELTSLAEGFSRKEFPALLRRAGLDGEPNRVRADATVPADVVEKMERLGTVDAFAAVRALHEAIRTDGESAERLAALSRAYAQLGALTCYQWSAAHQVFDARAMLYAQRVVARDPESVWALRNRAFVHALIGFHFLAIDELKEAKELDAKAEVSTPPQDWAETIDACLNDDVDRLAAVKGPHARLAAFLRMSALEFPSGTRIGVHAARDVIEADPDCDRAYDVVCQSGDLGDRHEMTVRGPVAFGASFPIKMKSLPGLPATVLEKFKGPADEPNAVAALAEAGKPGVDQGEPSWGVLAHLAREARFIHVWRRLHFMAVQWAVPVDEFWTQAGPWVADHRYLPFLETYVNPQDGYRLFAKFAEDLDLSDAELTENRLYEALRRIQYPSILFAWNVSVKHGGFTYWNHAASLDRLGSNQAMLARILHNISPHSRFAMAGLIAHDWDNVKGELPAWRAEAGDSPTLLGALGKKYFELKQYKEAEDCLTRAVARSADRKTYELLSDCYRAEGDDDRWKATLVEYLAKTENAGLDHARVQVRLADWFMAKEQWDEAKEYAEEAAKTWASWALLCAGRANEGLHDWERAEFWYEQAAERYPSNSMDLFLFRQRTQSVRPNAEKPDPDDEKAQLAALAGSAAMIKSGDAGFIHWLNGSTRKALDDLDAAYRAEPSVGVAAGLMLVADELGETEQRDAALEDLTTELKDKAPKSCAIFALFRDSLADGGKTPLDLAAVDAILESLPAATRGNTEFFVGRFLLNRGQAEQAKTHLQRCADSPTGLPWLRAIAAKSLGEPANEEK